tara:strand:- start:11351 stop:14731 length:3381 start_codon:yes stop_codon:yes gene_type:complete
MNRIFLPILLILAFINNTSFGQFIDDFSDGDFTNNPTWTGMTSNFEVNPSNQLHLNAPAQTDTSFLVTPSQAINNTVWEFYVELGFNPSSSNYADIYLVSDNANLKGNVNGYFVRIGNTTDEVSLYRNDGASKSEIIDGTDGRVNSSPVTVKVKVLRDNAGNWQLFSDTTGAGTNYVLEGTTSDNTYFSSQYFGVYCRYTSTRSTLFYFDDFNVTGTAFTDTVKPVIDSINLISSTALDIYFSENVDVTTAQNTLNYSVNNGIGTPSSAVIDNIDSSLVHLTFVTSFANGQNYILSVSGVQDRAGNIINTTNIPFTWFVPSTPAYGDVIINEIFADPSPQLGLPNAEFIEIHNPTNNYYDLSNWQFVNSTTAKTLPAYILAPGDYVILCSNNDTAAYNMFGNTIGISSFTALANSGDSLTLLDNTGQILDIVVYSDSWYNDATKAQGGWTLERINPVLPCSNENNWTASNNPNGGTPGQQNSVYSINPDTSAPYIKDVEVTNLFQLKVYFSETLDSNSAQNAIFSINNGITVGSFSFNYNYTTAVLNLTSALDSATVYSLTVSNTADCSGNNFSSAPFNFAIGVAPNLFDLVITEIFADPSPQIGLPEYEYIEIYNRSSKAISLKNCLIGNGSSMYKIYQNQYILPSEYVIICDDNYESFFTPYGKTTGASTMPSLYNTEGDIQLFSPDTAEVHFVHYFDDWYHDANKSDGGWSLEMIDYNNPCGESDNWAASNNPAGGTPGQQNSVYATNPDNISPKILQAVALSDSTVEVTFSEIIPLNVLQNALYYIDNGINTTNISVLSNKKVILSVFPKLQTGIEYTLSITNGSDCVGNTLSPNSYSFALPQPAAIGDIIINEVLFNPYTGGDDFVEIYNNSDKYIDLYQWMLANYDDSVSNFKTVSQEHIIIEPHQFKVFTTDTNSIKQFYPEFNSKAFIQVSSLPTYANDEGSVYLTDSNKTVIDFFNYSEDMHFSLLNSTDGVSLERISYSRPTNDKTNWHSAAEDVGFATPGLQNSQYNESQGEQTILSLSPEVFTPNNDGLNDVLNISYQLPEPGYVGNITIYDDKGRLVKYLMRNELLSAAGTISWDGTTENNTKALIGMYVIHFTAFNETGDKQKAQVVGVVGE